MPKTKKKKLSPKLHPSFFKKYQHFLIPSIIGGIIAWFFSGNIELGVVVFIAVWVGNWFGYSMLKKR